MSSAIEEIRQCATFTITSCGSTLLLAGELDLDSATVLESALAESVKSSCPIVLDLSNLTFMDSSGLHEILKAADVPGRCVILHGVHDLVARIIDLSGVNAIENVHAIPCHVAS